MAGAGLGVPLKVSLLQSEDLSVCASYNISLLWSESESPRLQLKVEFTKCKKSRQIEYDSAARLVSGLCLGYGFCEALLFNSFQPSGSAAAARRILMMSPGMNLSTLS
jgi:hypothetical protein